MNSHMQMQSIISIGLTSLQNPTESYKFIMDFQEVLTWYVRYVRTGGHSCVCVWLCIEILWYKQRERWLVQMNGNAYNKKHLN